MFTFNFDAAKAEQWLAAIENGSPVQDVLTVDDALTLAGVCQHFVAKSKNWTVETQRKVKEHREAEESGNTEKIGMAVYFNSFLASRVGLDDYSYQPVAECEVYFAEDNDRWQIRITNDS